MRFRGAGWYRGYPRGIGRAYGLRSMGPRVAGHHSYLPATRFQKAPLYRGSKFFFCKNQKRGGRKDRAREWLW